MIILRIIITLFIFSNLSYADDTLAYEKEAKAAIKELAISLKKSLKSVLKESGPIAAVEYCNIAALDITDRVSLDKGVILKRTSLKVRNAANIASSWEKEILNKFEKRKVLGESIGSIDYQEVYLDNNNKLFFRYMKAMPTGEVCLTCHGSNIKEPLQTRINELYPEDKAYGFKIGDIRGSFVIQIPLDN
ncbi:DUF3365 domain-containing protein [Alphaproteobacteria bacterium]|nr:DUF3365 domain-containing protein [Alphaproteobacteria bacterium]